MRQLGLKSQFMDFLNCVMQSRIACRKPRSGGECSADVSQLICTYAAIVGKQPISRTMSFRTSVKFIHAVASDSE